MLFDYLFLPVLFLIGLITAFQDLCYGKIKNKWIILGLAYGLLVLAGFFLWNQVAHPVSIYYYQHIKGLEPNSPMPVFTVSNQYLQTTVINFLLAVGVGFLMWFMKAWSAGDAKLFFVFALLLPLKYYSKSFLAFFPSFALLINIFIPIFLFFAAKALVFFFQKAAGLLRKKEFFPDLKAFAAENLSNWLRMLVAFLTMFLLMQLAQKLSGQAFSSLAQLASLAVLFIVGRPLSNILKYNWALVLILAVMGVSLGTGIIYFKTAMVAMLWQILYMALMFLLLMSVLNKVLELYINEQGIKQVSLDALRPTFQLSKEFMDGLQSSEPELYGKIKNEKQFSQESIAAIRNYCISRNQNTIPVYTSFPFAVWMLAGVALTIALKGSLISIVFRFFGII